MMVFESRVLIKDESLSGQLQLSGNPLVSDRTRIKIKEAVKKLKKALVIDDKINVDGFGRLLMIIDQIFGEELV